MGEIYFMKKLLVSDYDGTFFINKKDMQKNIEDINKFRDEGNIFAFATGNNYQNFTKVVKDNDIKYDYLLLDHGSVIVDKDGNLISACYIEQEVVDSIIVRLKESGFQYKLSTIWKDNCDDIFEVTKISVKIKDFERAQEVTEHISEKYGEFVNAYTMIFDDINIVEIISSATDKRKSIKVLADRLKLDVNNIYTIGNGYNDIAMIKAYNGYCMKDSVKDLLNTCNHRVGSVSDLVEEIL